MPTIILADLMKHLQGILLLETMYEAGVVNGVQQSVESKEPGSSQNFVVSGAWNLEPETYATLEDHCNDLGLIASAATVQRISKIVAAHKDGKGPTVALWHRVQEELRARLRDELEARTLLFIEPDRVRFYKEPDLFGPAVALCFGSAVALDIEEAGKCLALDRGTACVFHLMRVLEVALQRLAADLSVPDLYLEKNWQVILDHVNSAVKVLPHKTPVEKQNLSKRAAAASHLQNVKDAWRNDVMHPRESYTLDQALDVWNHTKALMAKLAEFL